VRLNALTEPPSPDVTQGSRPNDLDSVGAIPSNRGKSSNAGPPIGQGAQRRGRTEPVPTRPLQAIYEEENCCRTGFLTPAR